MSSQKSYHQFSENANNRRNIFRSLSISPHEESSKLIIILVGLPARGKSYISNKLSNFLNWRGHSCRVFNVGQYRRTEMSDEPRQNADFFSDKNSKNVEKRNIIALKVLEVAITWLNNKNGQIAIFDATNTTKSRRKALSEVIKKTTHRFLFVESICDDEKVIETNLKAKAEKSPDFNNMKFENALIEVRNRLKNYEKVYQTIDDEENYRYIKLINLGTKLISHKLHGYISRLLVVFLQNLNIEKTKIFLTRAGNSTADDLDKNLNDSPNYKPKESKLSKEGKLFSKKLADYVKNQKLSRLQIWTSTLLRAIETSKFFTIDKVKTEDSYLNNPRGKSGYTSIFSTPRLKMVHQGVCYGMRPSVIKETFPDYYNQWKKNPLTFRFPGGESYMDGVVRAESIVIDLEQTSTPVLIITHVSMMRILYAYFKSIPVDTVTDLNFPQGLVVEFKPSLYGWQEERIDLMQGKRKSVCDDTLNKDINNIPVENEIIYN